MHDSVRQAAGLHSLIIGRGVQDSNMVMISMIMDDTAKAKPLPPPRFKERMKKRRYRYARDQLRGNGVAYYHAQQRYTPDGKTQGKDYAAWKKCTTAMRPHGCRGLTDRALGYDIGNKNMVSIVFLVSDMKKAEEFGKSEALKKKCRKAGVEGAPQ